MVVIPRQFEPVRGEVKVSDLGGEDGGVALLPAGDGNVVARRELFQGDVLNTGKLF